MAFKIIWETFHDDPQVKALSDEEELFLLYAITCRHSHFSGIYFIRKGYITADKGWDTERIDRCISGLSRIQNRSLNDQSNEQSSDQSNDQSNEQSSDQSGGKFFLKYDQKTEIIWVRTMLKHQIINRKLNRNQLKAVENHLLTLPVSPLLAEFSQFYQGLRLPFFDQKIVTIPSGFPSVTESVSETVSETVSKESGNNMELTKNDKVRIWRLCEGANGKGFNAYAWLNRAFTAGVPIEVCEQVLKKYIKHKETVQNPWGYIMDILKKDFAEHNYAIELEKHYRLKNMDAGKWFKELAEQGFRGND